jgi:hypothetical protein
MALALMAWPAPADAHEDCPCHLKGVEHSVEQLNNGVRVSFIATDAQANPELVAKVQKMVAAHASRMADSPCMAGVQTSVDNLPNGARLTLTSSDEDTVKRLQSMHSGKGCPKGGKHHEDDTA